MYKDEMSGAIRKYISENVKPGEYLDFEEMNTEIAEKLYDSAITAERDPETAKEAYMKDPRANDYAWDAVSMGILSTDDMYDSDPVTLDAGIRYYLAGIVLFSVLDRMDRTGELTKYVREI